MKYLCIDTSLDHLLISIVIGNNIVFEKRVFDKSLSTKLISTIENGLTETDLSIQDIDVIMCVNGPGSFTGLRLGVTVAKMLGYTLNKKVIPFSSLEFMATTPCDGDYIIPYIDARRGYVYAGIYDSSLNVYMQDKYIKVEHLLKSLPKDKNTIFVGYSRVNGIDSYVIPKKNILSIIEKHKRDSIVNPHSINPNYLKKTEAEEKKYNDSKS